MGIRRDFVGRRKKTILSEIVKIFFTRWATYGTAGTGIKKGTRL